MTEASRLPFPASNGTIHFSIAANRELPNMMRKHMKDFRDKKDICIIVPMHKTKLSGLEEVSFQRIVKKFSSRKIFIICPQNVAADLSQLASPYPNMEVKVFDDKYFGKIIRHNNLLLSLEFYTAFDDYKYLLICHLDVMVIKDELDFWMNQSYDVVGAPILEGYHNDTTGKIKPKGSNGGYSLRNIKSCIKVLSSNNLYYNKLSSLWEMEKIWYWKLFRLLRDGIIHNYNIFNLKPRINEDMFWSVIAPDKFSWFKACPPQEALSFAFDANPKALYKLNNEKPPMAIHAWWRYDKDFVINLVKKTEEISIHTEN